MCHCFLWPFVTDWDLCTGTSVTGPFGLNDWSLCTTNYVLLKGHFSPNCICVTMFSVSLVFQQCTAHTLTWFLFISNPSVFLLGLCPRASASAKVVVRGLPRVSGNSNVSNPIMKARIPTMSYMGSWYIKKTFLVRAHTLLHDKSIHAMLRLE